MTASDGRGVPSCSKRWQGPGGIMALKASHSVGHAYKSVHYSVIELLGHSFRIFLFSCRNTVTNKHD